MAWAGKPSWSARATTDGLIRRSAVSSARAIAVRLRKASAVMPDDTCANPLVGNEAGQPITKFAALNGVCWPMRISPALTSESTTSSTTRAVDRHLQVLWRVLVGDHRRIGERVDEHASAVRAERGARRRGPHVGQIAELTAEFDVDPIGQSGRRGDQHDRAVGAVLGLDQQVGREAERVGAVVGDHDTLGRPEQHHRGDAVPLHLHLGDRDRRRTRPDDLAHPGEHRRAEPERRDARRPVGAEHVGDPQLATHHQHGGVDLAGAARNRRDDERDLRDTGDHGGHGELIGDARVAGLARRREQSDRADRRDLLTHGEPRLALDLPVAATLHLGFVEPSQVRDRIVEGGIDRVADDGVGDLGRAHPQLVGLEVDPVELPERIAHGFVTTVAHVVDQRPDRRPQVGVEDVVEPASEQGGAGGLVHGGPLLPAHHAHRADATADTIVGHRTFGREISRPVDRPVQ